MQSKSPSRTWLKAVTKLEEATLCFNSALTDGKFNQIAAQTREVDRRHWEVSEIQIELSDKVCSALQEPQTDICTIHVESEISFRQGELAWHKGSPIYEQNAVG